MDDSAAEPAVKFKRRKTTHAKRTRHENEDAPVVPTTQTPDAVLAEAETGVTAEEDGASFALKEILRNRKRPRDRLREAAARAEVTKAQALVLREQDAPKMGYADRFVPQTGQVVDRDDKQITEYIEARLAEKNNRLYDWPIPPHLAAAVAALAPETDQADNLPTRLSTATAKAGVPDNSKDAAQGHRLAAGMGKLQEVDLGEAATSRNIERTEAAWKKLECGHPDTEPAAKVRLDRDGKPRRQPKRRNSEDIRRDQMVEAVLREARLDYFDEPPPSTTTPGAANTSATPTDEALVEQFRQEFLDSIESQQQRKPAAPSGGALKGAREASKGPKMGGSRNARAAMRQQEELAAKNKR